MKASSSDFSMALAKSMLEAKRLSAELDKMANDAGWKRVANDAKVTSCADGKQALTTH